MSEPRAPLPLDLTRYTRVNWWSKIPAYRDAAFPSRMIVGAAMDLFMDRGSIPEDPNALRHAIGASTWRSFRKAYPAAREAIEALLPLWREELETALRLLQSQRTNRAKGGRPGNPMRHKGAAKGNAAPGGRA